MKAQEILNKIKNVVGVELSEEVSVQLEELKLDNGTILVAESFEAGKAVFIKSEEEEIALPVGEYALEDGRKLMVKEEGLIDAIMEAKEEEEEVEAKQETELEEEKEEMYVTKEEFALAVEEIKLMIEKIGDKEEMSEETEVEEKEELSAEVAEPIRHNPEKEDKKFNFKISNKEETTMDRIYNRLNNN